MTVQPAAADPVGTLLAALAIVLKALAALRPLSESLPDLPSTYSVPPAAWVTGTKTASREMARTAALRFRVMTQP